MAHDVLLKDARAVASTLSLEAQSKLLSDRKAIAAVVPQDVFDSMQAQGMNTGAFTPGEPIAPYQSVGTDPVITPFQVGQNIFAVPRGITGVGFSALKELTSNWDVARLCIEVREDELRGLDWEIVVEDGENADKYESELKAARRFFENPSPGQDFDDLQMKASEDWLRYDALAIARRRLKNGKLGALEAIDGTSIAPLIDGRGAMPQGPAPAYVQWSWGLPWVWLTERDIIYKPHHPRPETRYGLAPAEWVMLTANTDMRLQWYFLTYFTQGEVPEAFINAPPDVTDPKQVKALQDAYSAVMSGKNAAHHKVKWIPPGADVHTINKGQFDVGFAGFLLAKASAAFKVQPAEIGFTEKVNKSSGDTQADVTYRRAIKPTVKYFESIWNKILREDLNMPYARFKYLNIEEEEDQLKLAQRNAIYIQNAVLSPDDVRADLGKEVDENAPVGRAFAMRTGVIFVDAASQEAARKQGSLAQQYGLELGEEPDDDTTMIDPRQTIVAPVIKPVPPKPAQAGAPATTATATDPAKAAEDELHKWRTSALKRTKEGKAAKAWQSNALDPMLARMVNAQLAKARTQDEVREVFAPLIGGDAPLAKRTVPKRGKVVVRDQAKRDAAQKKMGLDIHMVFKKEAPKVAKHIAQQIQGARDETIATIEADVDALLASYKWKALQGQTVDAAQPHIQDIFALGADEGAKTIDAGISFDIHNPAAIQYAEERGAEMVGMKRLADGTLIQNPATEWNIADSTRDFLQTAVSNAMNDGQSPYELQQTILDNYAFSESRAEAIARTETGLAYNKGGIAGYRAAQVQHVEVEDGEDDPDCAAANGQTWTVDHAEANPLAHPNCTRSFAPIPPDEDPDYVPLLE